MIDVMQCYIFLGPAMVYLSPLSKQQDEELKKFPLTYPCKFENSLEYHSITATLLSFAVRLLIYLYLN